ATGLHPVFFGQMISGPNMPALTYMIYFKDMEERDANWAKFIDHPDWKTMSSKEEYANSVSEIIRIFLTPLDISQV
ncbi:MAG: NIPSNAP family protein, partial [Lewinella sp.]|nr:NIPSNAP family protein [Lewinella sp.]